MPKLLFFITEDWYFCSHRLPLARAAIKAGFEVVLLTNVQAHGDMIRSEGIRVIPLALQRRSMNPLRELKTILHVVGVYRAERPDIVHHVAMKPVLYGSVAAFVVSMHRVVNALAGMGYLFISESLMTRALRACIKRLYSFFLNRNESRIILQNPDDARMFVKYGMAEEARICLIRGSGVNVSIFAPTPELPQPVTVVLPARMLLDKGVVEFVAAARILIKQGCVARFILVGNLDPENPAAIAEEQLHLWQQEQNVEWWGHRSDMPAVLEQAHIVCLPSYREGVPKALLEAAACGRPIVATDVPGCREIVREGVNGLLVPARNALALAEALRTLIDDKELREQMGAKGREIVLNDFSEQKIVAETLAVYQDSSVPGSSQKAGPSVEPYWHQKVLPVLLAGWNQW
jgi:glycosyltransferase involved in cell wall biosynthesis